MPAAFFDTNVFLYAALPQLEPRDEAKRQIAIELIAQEDYVISSQVLAEFYHNAVRKKGPRLSHALGMGWIERLSEQPCLPVDPALVETGAAFSERYQISYWDGAMIAAAQALAADRFYTEDLNDGQIYGTVKVINPFKSSNH